MADGHGGYRKPNKPAPVSGPGALSRRTDGGPSQPVRRLPNADYGESAEYEGIQKGAPVAKSPPPGVSSTAAGGGAPDLVSLNAPTARPGEPVTHGAEMGPGAGPDVLGLGNSASAEEEGDLTALAPYLAELTVAANQHNASPSTRNFVRRLRSAL